MKGESSTLPARNGKFYGMIAAISLGPRTKVKHKGGHGFMLLGGVAGGS